MKQVTRNAFNNDDLLYFHYRSKIIFNLLIIGLSSFFLIFIFYSDNLYKSNMSIEYFSLSIILSVILLSAIYIMSCFFNYYITFKKDSTNDMPIKRSILENNSNNQSQNLGIVEYNKKIKENTSKNNSNYSQWGVKQLSVCDYKEECKITTEREKQILFKSEQFHQMLKEKGYDESKWNWQLEARKKGEMNVISDDDIS
jgi:hypothetical protein